MGEALGMAAVPLSPPLARIGSASDSSAAQESAALEAAGAADAEAEAGWAAGEDSGDSGRHRATTTTGE
jgi:hypothetical protein